MSQPDRNNPPVPGGDRATDSSNGRRYTTRSEGPRRVRDGIRLRKRETLAASNWVARRWVALLQGIVPEEVMAAGFEYARIGQIVSLEIAPGRIEATVQGRAARPYHVQAHFPALDEEGWDRLINAMADEARFVARLLANDLPESVDRLFDRHNVHLLPADPHATRFTCTCPVGRKAARTSGTEAGAAAPASCKHVAAMGCLVAERLSDDPLAVFEMYGMPATRLLDRLRQARLMQTQGVAAAHTDPPIAAACPAPPALEDCLDAYWRPGPQLAELQRLPPPQHAPHALLRRLGPSPMKARFPMVGLLASVYDVTREAARQLRDESERRNGG